MYFQNPTDDYLQSTPLANWEITSLVISTNAIHVTGNIKDEIREGFYGLKIDLESSCLRHLKTFVTKSVCSISTSQRTLWGVPNVGLVDEDYPKKEVAFGTFLPFNVADSLMTFDFHFLIGDYKNYSNNYVQESRWGAVDVNWFSTPCYDAETVSRRYQLKGLYLASPKSNGLDLVIDGLDKIIIHPKGNIVIPFFETIPNSLNLLCGTFILRSRFMRKGLSLIVDPSRKYWWLMNNGSQNSIGLKERTFQYLPLGTTNLAKFADFELNQEFQYQHLYRRWSTPEKYIITVNDGERKSKFIKDGENTQ